MRIIQASPKAKLKETAHISQCAILAYVIRCSYPCYVGSHDYCVGTGFTAECPTGEILLMQEAIYGRMELGTCLTLDIGFMNCQR